MANAKKCNRCKTCFDPLEIAGEMCQFQNPVFRTAKDMKNNTRSGTLLLQNGYLDDLVDLCPDCAKAFRRFMDKPGMLN